MLNTTPFCPLHPPEGPVIAPGADGALPDTTITAVEALEQFLESVTCTVYIPVSYTHLRAHETVLDIVCRLLLEKKK